MAISKWINWSIASVLSMNVLLISPVKAFQDAPSIATQEDNIQHDRRNPRLIRRENGEVGPPRMVGGRMSMDGGDTLKYYNKLEPLIGTFSIDGKSWRSPEVNPNLFAGILTI